jgi:hypothetical protein
MARKAQEIQKIIRHYKEVTGKKEVDMHEVTAWAVAKGWPLPTPISPIDRLTKEFSKAAREEVRKDPTTGRPYRANHAFSPDGNRTLWIDIDEAPRGPMWKSAVTRREQMVGDALQLSLDLDHWNSIHPDDEPIVLPLDLTDDVEWRKNGEDDQAAA